MSKFIVFSFLSITFVLSILVLPLQLFFPIVTVIPKFLKALSAASSEMFRFPVSQ
nr:MAG TPA: hypothetical protein [Caudoviricetes sp.]